MLTIIVKGTNGCNLACNYCSLGEKKNFRFVDEKKLYDIFQYSCKYVKYRNEANVNFILHGGEPTLIDIEIYEKAIERIQTEFPDLKIRFFMQSNGLVISEKTLEFLHKFDIHMGISIDGSKEIHDLERRTVGGEATFEQIINNILKMCSIGINVSCLMVLTKNAIGKGYDFLDFFVENHIHLKINPLLNYGDVYEHPELSLESGDYAKYLIGLYEYSIENNVSITMTPIDNILCAILNEQRIGECSFNSKCNEHFLCVDYKGDIYPCGKFSDMDKYLIGNIDKTDIVNIDGSIMKKLRKRRNEKKPNKCNNCKFLRLCNCGCSAEALIDGNFDEVPILCEDYKILFEYFHGEGLTLLKRELLRQKKLLEA